MKLLQTWSFIACFLLACTEAASMYGEILSPNYPQPYPNNALESWEISVPPGYGIRLYFTLLDIEPSQDCEYDFVKVHSGGNIEGQLCGQKKSRKPGSHIVEEFYVPYNTLTVTFQSDFSNEERFTGFAAYYAAVDLFVLDLIRDYGVFKCLGAGLCPLGENKQKLIGGGRAYLEPSGEEFHDSSNKEDVNECTDFVEALCSHYCNNYIGGYFCSCPSEYFLHEDQRTCGVNCTGNVFTELSGEISSPNYPSLYPENSHCDYRVILEPGYRVVLTIDGKKDFDIEPADSEGNCQDTLRILAGDQHLGPYCGSIFSGPPEIKTKSNIVDIFFQTNEATQGRGWKLRYFGDPMPCPKTIVPNAVLDPTRDHYVFKDSVMVTCIEGYEVVMPQGSLTSFYSRCQSNGKWSNSGYRCVPVDCGMPDPLENGNVTYLSGAEETHYQALIRYECHKPYYTEKDSGNGVYQCSASGEWVNEEKKTELPVCIPVCGVPHTPIGGTGRIFGGWSADAGNFPWQIYFHNPRGGGALISDRWILTAAHVLDGNPNPTVYAGLLYAGLNARSKVKPLVVEDTVIHPNWIGSVTEPRTNFDNDIALLKLKERVTMGPNISLICLPGRSSEYDPKTRTLGFIAGWGQTEKKDSSLRLRAASVPVQDMDMCRSQKPDPPSDSLSYVFTDNMICAGGGGKDSCYGDSGGPYAILDPHNDTRYYVAGLVSWGPKCGTYGLYTKVANYVDWIVGVISQHDSQEPEE